MNDLLNKKFFRLLSESSQVSNEVMQVASDAFIKGIIEISSSEEVLPAGKYVPFSANKDDPKSANKDA